MLVSIIPIGNSKGIRLPKNIMNELMIEDKVEMTVRNNEIIIKPVGKNKREGWEEAFANMHLAKDDSLLITDELNDESFDWDW